jgi:hypothetical protein
MAEIIKNSMVKRGFSPSVITATIHGRSVISTRRKLRQAIGELYSFLVYDLEKEAV